MITSGEPGDSPLGSARGKPAGGAPAGVCLSMTGYAQARTEYNGWAIRVSLRSVNHKSLDLRVRLPEGFEIFEPRLRQTARARIRRGHVEVAVVAEAAGASAVQVNRALAEAYLREAVELRREMHLGNEPDVVGILRLPGVIAAGPLAVPDSEEEQEKLGAELAACLETAVTRLEEMRRHEGAHLAEEMSRRLRGIAERAAQIECKAEAARPAFARRLEARLREFAGGAGVDPARVAQEAAILAERSDVTEELSRLKSHVAQFGRMLEGAGTPGELGKRLDFLLQEMQRETNTLLAKSPGVEAEGLAITDLGLEIKAEIEKLREQVQNVE
jgi:uncharacterized protein (TIGR00255 family)